jgi:hypothetical protein
MIVDNKLYAKAIDIIATREVVLVPVPLNYSLHPKESSLCVIYVRDLKDNQSYLIPINHPDTIHCYEIPTNIFRAYVPSIKESVHLGIKADNLIDLELLHYYNTGKKLSFEKTSAQNFIERKFWKYNENNKLVPILKLLEYCKNNRKTYIETIDNIGSLSTGFIEFNRDITGAYSYLESNGLHTTSNTEYTHYNLFTATGRPSNTHNGINYAALNKEDGSRDRFTSRFDNGMMVEFDFDAYHLRLISNLIKYTLPDGSVHEYLGKYYFDKDTLTPEEYQEAKRINFKILYGGIPKEFNNIEFFRLIGVFISKLWHEWKSKSYITTYLYKRRMTKERLGEMNPQKLFNYYIQAYETEHNIQVIKRFKEVLDDKQTKVVLCTYDSFLFDFNISDGLETLQQIKSAMDIPSKVSIGANYGTMIDKSL